jgi:hypothetical protein
MMVRNLGADEVGELIVAQNFFEDRKTAVNVGALDLQGKPRANALLHSPVVDKNPGRDVI